MKARNESFQVYLRGEVDAAGKQYDAAVQQVFHLLDDQNGGPGPELVGAIQALSENLRLYSGAIRRMSHFAAHH